MLCWGKKSDAQRSPLWVPLPPLSLWPLSPPLPFLLAFLRACFRANAFCLHLLRLEAFLSPRLSDFILLSTTFNFAPFGTFPFSIRLPPPPFFTATTVTLRSSCFAILLTARRICRAFAASLISG